MKPDRIGFVSAIARPLAVVAFAFGFLFFLCQKDVEILQAQVGKLEQEISVNAAEMVTIEERVMRLQASLTFEVVASWYGDLEHGRTTANMEIFDRHGMTAASKFLPFNSRWRVTNLENGLSVTVRINDDGPNKKGRGLDLSEAAAHALGMIRAGVVRVKVSPEI